VGKIIALVKRKGGAGASTIAANLGAELDARGLSVTVLDADPQRSLLVWASLGQGGALQRIVNGVEDALQGAGFKARLEAEAQQVDRLIVDCEPGFSSRSVAAATLAHLVLIPCRPSPLDVAAAVDALDVAKAGTRGRRDAKIAFVPSANLPRTRIGKALPADLEVIGAEHGALVLPSISARIVVAESALSGQSVREAEPGGEAAKEFAALADAVEGVL